MTVLVTGAAGFVGRSLVARLAEAGVTVRALMRDPARASVLPTQRVTVARGDLLDADSLVAACEGADAVVHLAAVIRESAPDQTFERVNVTGTGKLLEAAARAGVGRLVYASTIGAVDDAGLRYMRSRWMAEGLVRDSGIPYSILRFSVGFGEGDEFMNMLAAQVKVAPIAMVPGDGRARFQPIAVEDAARCLCACLDTDATLGRTYDLGGPEYLTYDELMRLVAKTIGSRVVLAHLPMPVMRMAVGLMERFLSRPPVTSEQLKMLDLNNVTDLDSVSRAFGFEPRPIRGNVDYVRRIGSWDAIRMNLGSMPVHIRDH